MKIRCLPLVAALAFTVSPLIALAQASAPQPMRAASSSPSLEPAPQRQTPLKPAPRLMTPAEERANADESAAPEARPERPVTPQLTIPLGRKAAPELPARAGSTRARPAASSGVIDDTAARCESLAGKQERDACRSRPAAAPATR